MKLMLVGVAVSFSISASKKNLCFAILCPGDEIKPLHRFVPSSNDPSSSIPCVGKVAAPTRRTVSTFNSIMIVCRYGLRTAHAFHHLNIPLWKRGLLPFLRKRCSSIPRSFGWRRGGTYREIFTSGCCCQWYWTEEQQAS